MHSHPLTPSPLTPAHPTPSHPRTHTHTTPTHQYTDINIPYTQAFLGRENMRKFRETAVLIVGVNGLSAEIGKNIILANIYKVTLWDTADVAIGDLGAHFYLSESDVGSNRAAACVAAMQ